jgi:hypothetical protein
MLESPLPFVCGVKIRETDFAQRILPSMLKNQTNALVVLNLDSQLVELHGFKVEDIKLPQFGGAWSFFMNEYAKYHSLKTSRSIILEKTKSKTKKEFYVLKSKKPEKKTTPNKSKPKTIPEEVKLGILGFFKRVVMENLLNPLQRMNRKQVLMLKLGKLAATFAEATDPDDADFIIRVLQSQLFSYYLENDY